LALDVKAVTIALYALVVYAPVLYLGLGLARYGSGWRSRAVGYALVAVAIVNVYFVGLLSFISYSCLAIALACRVVRLSRPAASMLLGFILSGLLGGSLLVLYYPAESIIYLNAPAALLGDELYDWAVSTLGQPGSPQAHETVPPMLRPPLVYLTTSLALWTIAGIPFMLAAGRVFTEFACPASEGASSNNYGDATK
jgi:phosphoglycerol transferase MdoB-like AlkP superfamily enzyme